LLDKDLKPGLIKHFEEYFRTKPSKRADPQWVSALPADQQWCPNNSVQFIEYEPEVERYGGPSGIVIAEEQFELSSRVVLDVIKESAAWDYERALGAAIQLHLAFAHTFKMDKSESAEFYADIFKGWFASAYGYSEGLSKDEIGQRQEVTLKAFEEQLNNQKNMLVNYHQMIWEALQDGYNFEQEWMNQWISGMKLIARKLTEAQSGNVLQFSNWVKPDKGLSTPAERQFLWSIIGSYVHMTNNRLGILNRDEAFLGYIIKNCLKIIE
jgi:thiopeptide-type bacteriocin biosynthesis protein